jgi:hypothetical protein
MKWIRRHIPSDNLGEGLDVAVDDLVTRGLRVGAVAGRRLHDDEPVLEVASIKEDRLLWRPVGPAGGRVPQRGGCRLRGVAPHRPVDRCREKGRGRGERTEEEGGAAGRRRVERRSGEEGTRRRRHGGRNPRDRGGGDGGSGSRG